jgi:POT family proton-dependent oligopeptide transporter
MRETAAPSTSMPAGVGVIFSIQIFSTMSFAVLFATLVLYMKQQLHLSSTQADTLTGVYFAYNFALHLLSGYLAGRLFSYRLLIVAGLIFQMIGCVVLAQGQLVTLYAGLAFMLIGTGSMVTCINMLVSQLFDSHDPRRETAFLWNYSGMNAGFLLGFTLAGYFQLSLNYNLLFLLTAFSNVVTLIIMAARWPALKDRDTFFKRAGSGERIRRLLTGIFILCLLAPLLYILLKHEKLSNDLIVGLGILMVVVVFMLGMRHKGVERHRLLAFLMLLIAAQIFWIIYQLAPMGLTLFAQDNVDRHLGGILIAPGWIQNINSITIIIGGPLLAILFKKLREQNRFVSLPVQYCTGIFLSALGLIILPWGIHFANVSGYMNFSWLFVTYVLQAIGELLISPIGYAMVGQLVPRAYQSQMMGVVLLNSGVAAVMAGQFSNYALGNSGSTNPLITNPSYSHAFNQLGWFTFGIAVLLMFLTPWLKRLIQGKSLQENISQ